MLTFPRRAALLSLTLSLLLGIPASASAETVLFACSENCPLPLFEALELELRGHGAFLVARLSPSGFSVDAHESDARRMALLVPAAAALWIEREAPLRVRVFSPKDNAVREAPLASPPETIDARTFAAIAGNVVLQALHAPGHTDSPAREVAPANAEAKGPLAALAPTPPVSTAESADRSKAKAERPRFQRFFLRAGAALGFAYVKSGMKTDRPPSQDLVNGALDAQTQANSAEVGKEYLRDKGFDCSWEAAAATNQYVANHCKAAIKAPGFNFAPGIDIQAGAYVTPQLALAAVLRIAPDAGLGTFNHALFGAQGEYALIAPKSRGFWLNVGLGFAFGHLQVQPAHALSRTSYVTSGPGEAHALVSLGYRFFPNFGLYASPTLRLLFPDLLWMIEPTLGVEVRL